MNTQLELEKQLDKGDPLAKTGNLHGKFKRRLVNTYFPELIEGIETEIPEGTELYFLLQYSAPYEIQSLLDISLDEIPIDTLLWKHRLTMYPYEKKLYSLYISRYGDKCYFENPSLIHEAIELPKIWPKYPLLRYDPEREEEIRIEWEIEKKRYDELMEKYKEKEQEIFGACVEFREALTPTNCGRLMVEHAKQSEKVDANVTTVLALKLALDQTEINNLGQLRAYSEEKGFSLDTNSLQQAFCGLVDSEFVEQIVDMGILSRDGLAHYFSTTVMWLEELALENFRKRSTVYSIFIGHKSLSIHPDFLPYFFSGQFDYLYEIASMEPRIAKVKTEKMAVLLLTLDDIFNKTYKDWFTSILLREGREVDSLIMDELLLQNVFENKPEAVDHFNHTAGKYQIVREEIRRLLTYIVKKYKASDKSSTYEYPAHIRNMTEELVQSGARRTRYHRRELAEKTSRGDI